MNVGQSCDGIVIASPSIPLKRSPTTCVSRMYPAQPVAAMAAKSTPTQSMAPVQGSVSRSTPPSAMTGCDQVAAVLGPEDRHAQRPQELDRDRRAQGIRSIAARKNNVIVPVISPRTNAIRRSAGR